jgi:DNA-binding MarR family transcriptional regulator
MPYTPSGALFTNLTAQVLKLAGLIVQQHDLLAVPTGQTGSRWQVMAAIDPQPKTVATIARSLGLTRQSVQRTADLLVADELVEYQHNPEHKRAQLLRLTLQGQRLLTALEQAQAKWANQISGTLTPAELTQSVSLLEEVLHLLGASHQRNT